MEPSFGPRASAVRRTARDWRVMGMPRGSVGMATWAAMAVRRVMAGTLRMRRVARSREVEPVRDSGVLVGVVLERSRIMGR